MKIALFSSKKYDQEYFDASNNKGSHQVQYFDVPLNAKTSSLARGYDAVCAFVNDQLNEECLRGLQQAGVRNILLRSAGFNHVDLEAAKNLEMRVSRVPSYSPHAVAEHTLALILCLNRKIHKAYNRVREGNFELDGLLGFDLQGKTVGIIGTGQVGTIVVKILSAFGAKVLTYDPFNPNACAQFGAQEVSLDELLSFSNVISLHCPLTLETKHLVNEHTLARMPKGVMIINTGRGALIDTRALISGLKSKHIGYVGLDVYEEEGPLFFSDHSLDVISDDIFARLLTFPNVLITGHQGFFTREAMEQIASVTLANASALEQGKRSENELF